MTGAWVQLTKNKIEVKTYFVDRQHLAWPSPEGIVRSQLLINDGWSPVDHDPINRAYLLAESLRDRLAVGRRVTNQDLCILINLLREVA